MSKERNTYDAVEEMISSMGFSREFGMLIAESLVSDKARLRMVSYLAQFQPTRMEDIADEMLSINAQFESWRRKKIGEYYNAKYNILLRDGLGTDEDEEEEDLQD